jgi:hypothetical protein
MTWAVSAKSIACDKSSEERTARNTDEQEVNLVAVGIVFAVLRRWRSIRARRPLSLALSVVIWSKWRS